MTEHIKRYLTMVRNAQVALQIQFKLHRHHVSRYVQQTEFNLNLDLL